MGGGCESIHFLLSSFVKTVLTFYRWADDYHGHVMYADSDDLWHWTKMVDIPDGVSSKVRHGTILRQV